jgi:hypothetical protein
MAIKITAQNHLNEAMSVNIDRFPNVCPACKRHIDAAFSGASLYPHSFKPLYVVYRCPVEQCRALFVATYRITTSPATNSTGSLLENPPLFWTEEIEFPVAVRTVSPTFVVIYNQANRAEQNELDQVAGPGYRKALEHLVKDFLSAMYATDEKKKNDVLRSFLGACIEKYVDDPRLKAVAKRAAWLGNDETHYLRKWTDKDLQDLKSLVGMTVSWIDLVMTSKQYIDSMPE